MPQHFSESEIHHYRSLFPVTERYVYFNHAGVAPISRPVAEAIHQFTQESLEHGFVWGPQWHQEIEQIRTRAAHLIGAGASEIAFVKNTSHGISLVAQGLSWKAGDEVVIAEGEFPANVYPWMALESKGVVLKKIPVQDGELVLATLDSLITHRTRVVSLSSVQYGNGFRLPIEKIGHLCRNRGIYFHLDAIQSLGAFPIEVGLDKVDFLSADAHKWLLGPEGIGIFYARKELIGELNPTLIGWNSVEHALDFDHIHFQLKSSAQRFEEGSHCALSIYALGAAIDLITKIGIERIAARILYLTDLLAEGLQRRGMILTHCLKPEARSGIVTCRLPDDPKGVRLHAMERGLFSKNIFVSIRQGNLRFSPHFYNTEEEVNQILKVIDDFGG